METAQSNPFSEDSWSEQPIVAEQKMKQLQQKQ